MALVAAIPAAAAIPVSEPGVGQASILMGVGCTPTECHPGAYAWVVASACVPADADPVLLAHRVPDDDAPSYLEMATRSTGNPSCPHLATGRIDFWLDVVESPTDCLQASVIGALVLHTRAECF